jgi:hypothetical protein
MAGTLILIAGAIDNADIITNVIFVVFIDFAKNLDAAIAAITNSSG